MRSAVVCGRTINSFPHAVFSLFFCLNSSGSAKHDHALKFSVKLNGKLMWIDS